MSELEDDLEDGYVARLWDGVPIISMDRQQLYDALCECMDMYVEVLHELQEKYETEDTEESLRAN